MATEIQKGLAQRRPTLIRFGRCLSTILAMLLLTSASRANEVKVKVIDQDNTNGVKSQIMMSRAKEKEKIVEVDRTDDNGELQFSHQCVLGDRLFAQPIDGSYYLSEKETCKEAVLLQVKKRPFPEDELVARSRIFILLEYADGNSRQLVAEYDGVVRGQEVYVGGREGEFCHMIFSFRMDRDLYFLEDGGTWRRAHRPGSFSETLARDRTKTCAENFRRTYKRVENLGKEQLGGRLEKNLQELLSHLREMEGVEKVEVQR